MAARPRHRFQRLLLWPALWRIVWSHCEAYTLAALRALDAALAEPKATKAGLRRRMLAALAAIAARGPEEVPPTPPQG